MGYKTVISVGNGLWRLLHRALGSEALDVAIVLHGNQAVRQAADWIDEEVGGRWRRDIHGSMPVFYAEESNRQLVVVEHDEYRRNQGVFIDFEVHIGFGCLKAALASR